MPGNSSCGPVQGALIITTKGSYLANNMTADDIEVRIMDEDAASNLEANASVPDPQVFCSLPQDQHDKVSLQ